MKNIDRIIVSTSNFELIRKRVLYTIDTKSFALISGQNGYGKTAGLEYLSDQYSEIKYFRIGVGETGRAFYARFLTEISSDEEFDPRELERESYINLMLERATFIINQRKDIKLVVIDEFGNHTLRFIPFFRQIWDNIQENAGLLLAGPPSALKELKDWRAAEKKGINEIFSRLGNRIEKLEKHNRMDTEMICHSRGITEDFEINFFHENCSDLRLLHMLIDDYKAGLLKVG